MNIDPTPILTHDESLIIKLLQYVVADADDFGDPENGDFLDRMEALFHSSAELDATVVKIVLDRVHFFMGAWIESSFSGESYEVIPATSPSTERLQEALESTTVTASTGVKKELLEIVDSLQVTYFWRDSSNPDPEVLRALSELIVTHNIKDGILAEFVEWNVLFPWNDWLGISYADIHVENEHAEWSEQCRMLNASQWAGI